METRYKVVMLPTNEATHIINDIGQLQFIESEQIASTINSIVKGYHLYIVDTQVTPKAGDWVYNTGIDENDVIHHIIKKVEVSNSGFDNWTVIIASTDNTLGLPAIENHFIQKYCENPELALANLDEHTIDWMIIDGEKVESEPIPMVNFDFKDNQSTQEVDFELLKEGVESLESYVQDAENDYQANRFRNLKLFFEQLKDPSFALQASEWLRSNC